MREGKMRAGRERERRRVATTVSLVYDVWMQAVSAANQGKGGTAYVIRTGRADRGRLAGWGFP